MNNFISGGQVFTHKIRMLWQVIHRSSQVAGIVSIVLTICIAYKPAQKIDWLAAYSFLKAKVAVEATTAINYIRNDPSKYRPLLINVNSSQFKKLNATNVNPSNVVKNNVFITAADLAQMFLKHKLKVCLSIFTSLIAATYLIWSGLGENLKKDKHISGAEIHTAKQVKKILKSINQNSDLLIGDMPLVKDSETKHILITGTTGAGKTNLLHNFLPQIIKRKNPAIFLDQTGEMIARYYDPNRGDLIFNPLDSRAHTWDFWRDNCIEYDSGLEINPRLEKFAKVLFGYGKRMNTGGDPFWDNSAETVFCSCAEKLIADNNKSIAVLNRMLNKIDAEKLSFLLKDTNASRYLESCGDKMVASILSVLASNTKPLILLTDKEPKFSLHDFFLGVKKGNPRCLFLSSPPSLREVTIPLQACLFELAIANLIELGDSSKRRVWFVLDELASLGRIKGLSTLLSEGRKYGGCVLAATQSVNQLFENFGIHIANHIFGQFATKFMFRTDDPASAKLISSMFGELEYSHQQQNTSFGASEYRDGISYTKQQLKKMLITPASIASLADHECFVGLPFVETRIAKINVPLSAKDKDPNQPFIMVNSVIEAEKIVESSVLEENNRDEIQPQKPEVDVLQELPKVNKVEKELEM